MDDASHSDPRPNTPRSLGFGGKFTKRSFTKHTRNCGLRVSKEGKVHEKVRYETEHANPQPHAAQRQLAGSGKLSAEYENNTKKLLN